MMAPEKPVEVVKIYNGKERKYAIGRFVSDSGRPGLYRVGVFVKEGISFATKEFKSREDAEGYLVYSMDDSVRLYP